MEHIVLMMYVIYHTHFYRCSLFFPSSAQARQRLDMYFPPQPHVQATYPVVIYVTGTEERFLKVQLGDAEQLLVGLAQIEPKQLVPRYRMVVRLLT